VAFDLAAHYLGLVPVPLYTEDRPENAAYILGDVQCRLLLVQSAAQWRRLAPALTDLASLQRVVLLDGARSNSSARRCWDGLVGWLKGCIVECGWVFFMTKIKGGMAWDVLETFSC